jgi:hypothetical protein
MGVYSSINPVPVDAPFLKLLNDDYLSLHFPGVPHYSSSEYSLQQRNVYDIAARLLGFISTDPMYIAFRIRHLAHCIRNSKFKDRISWRSGLQELDNLDPIFNQSSGMVESFSTPNLKIRHYISGPLDKFNLQWSLGVYGTYSTNINIDINGVFSQTWNGINPLSFELGTSGYNVTLTSTGGTGTSVEGLFKFITPYECSLVEIVSDIKLNKDFLNQILYNKQEYIDAILHSNSIEDSIAAFILAINEI